MYITVDILAQDMNRLVYVCLWVLVGIVYYVHLVLYVLWPDIVVLLVVGARCVRFLLAAVRPRLVL